MLDIRRCFFLLALSGIWVTSWGQASGDFDPLVLPQPTQAEGVRYWFDDDAGSLSSASLSGRSFSLDVSALLDGIHTVHYQLVDNTGMVTPPNSVIFLKMNDTKVGTPSPTKELCYWFDDQQEVATSIATNGISTLDVSGLLDCIHTVHYQAIDEGGKRGYISSAIFLKMNDTKVGTPGPTKELCYWFDDQQEVATSVATNGISTLDVSGLLDGIHTVHYQAIDESGKRGYISSAIFLKMNDTKVGTPSPTKELCYWFDDQQEVATSVATNGISTLDVSGLLDGIHTVHYQAIDESGKRGYISSAIFLKMNDTKVGTPSPTKELCYWFDDQQEVATSIATNGISTLDVSGLLDGIHTVHYQAIDESGKRGYISSAIFLKMNDTKVGTPSPTKELCYWFDDQQEVATSVATNGISTLDVSGLLDGIHTVHYQAIDESGKRGYISSAIFLKMNDTKVGTPGPTKELCYWFDDQQEVATSIATNGISTLDVSGLLDGIHTVHYQAIDEGGKRGYISSAIFLKMNDTKVGTPSPTKELCYWFDDQQEVATSVATNGISTLDVSGLLDGIHTVHYQAIDESGKRGYISSAIFLKMNDTKVGTPSPTKELCYWFDDQQEVATSVATNGISTLDVSGLLDGIHTVHYQAIDEGGKRGYISSAIFLKMNDTNAGPAQVTPRKLIYWFDDEEDLHDTDYAGGVVQLDASHLESGEHYLHCMVLCSEGYLTSSSETVFLTHDIKVLVNEDGSVVVDNPNGELPDLAQSIEDAKILIARGHFTEADVDVVRHLKNLLVIKWNSNEALPERITDAHNPNLITYVKEGTDMERDFSQSKNIVLDGEANALVLTDGSPLLIPESFTASTATYSKLFEQPTVQGQASGWRTIVLPYDVQTFTEEGSEATIAPFGASATADKRFWLAGLTDEGFAHTDKLEANVPYIIAMPNSANYKEELNISGQVRFESHDVLVQATTDARTTTDNQYVFVPAYEPASVAKAYTINDAPYRSYPAGSVFVRDYRDVRPFEGYLMLAPNMKYSPYIRLDDMMPDQADVIPQIADTDAVSPGVYNLNGQRLQPAQSLPTGIYIVNKKKVVVK